MPDDTPITRKDFLNATLLGVGAALLGAPSPAAALGRIADPWTGPGGVGDYAASNGNTKAVVDAAHGIRDGTYGAAATDVDDPYDLVVVGGGISGLAAAHFFAKATGGAKRCLVLENHPIFGGEAKQNEVDVDGVRLVGPQGSNDFGVPRAGSGWLDDLWTELALPREFRFAEWGSRRPALRAAQDNYQPMEGVGEYGIDVGYQFAPGGPWLRNVWQNDLADAPLSDGVRRELLRWRSTPPDTKGLSADAFARRLDTMSYRDWLEKELGYSSAVTKTIEPVIGLISGASPDAVSAHAAQQIGMPGVSRPRGRTGGPGLSFPGGNTTYARHLVKALVPDAITGPATFEGIFGGTVRWAALDRPRQHTRIRVGATVVRVAHDGAPGASERVLVTYALGGRLRRVRARRVIMATGGWVNRRVLTDAPAELRAAYADFAYAPALVVNVALRNWRFLERLGITAARWFDDRGLGFVANVRRPMVVGARTEPFDPDRPAMLTFYMGLYTPGMSAAEQGVANRAKLLATPYREYERTLRAQLARQFGASGFDPRRDVAGIILNRWGHARLVQPPGWYYGRDGEPAPREIVARGYGRIAIAHSELNGHQSATGALAQGRRAALETAGA
ncbi:FAD dependent oxidoreductase (plasmid) [Gemmatirosa kalamazoonensis]|uniref:FAD dependent oxidoreductase n=1 Tax=Gemmatirosa kalamazoonensis TaxID=861299 RepID=W0RT34_9BACT|nr:NAD(P)-binding protein [Gemmatirosa kalamazoonensis]AHG93480.1 FAD dependent oxidoreductase [Gemmatirosa kalamazoonensis]